MTLESCMHSNAPEEVFKITEAREIFYRRIIRQAFSPDGNWLVAAHTPKTLTLFSISGALSSKTASSPYRQYASTWMFSRPIFALKTLSSFLICGDSNGKLYGYHWDELSQIPPTLGEQVFSLNGFSDDESVPAESEINSVEALDERKILYAGGGDNATRLVDIEHPDKVISKYVGHKSHVNEIAVRTSSEFLSASEDGTVRLWDTRSCNSNVFKVSSESSLDRKCGHGVCALAVDDDFMVCGGDVDLGIWHLGSRSLASPLLCNQPATMRHTVAKMIEGKILTGGTCPYLFQFDYAGAQTLSVKTSLNGIYSVEKNGSPLNAIVTVAGDSHLIDAFLSLGYVSFSFNTSKLPGDIFDR